MTASNIYMSIAASRSASPPALLTWTSSWAGCSAAILAIVAARPGVGKTSLLLSIGLSAARRYHQRVAVFSLEMSSEQVVQRLISQETGIDSQRLRLGEVTKTNGIALSKPPATFPTRCST